MKNSAAMEVKEAVAGVTLAGVSARVRASDKRMINGQTDVNQLVPFKYGWSWQMYLDSCTRHWMPQEFHLQKDVVNWSKASDALKNAVVIPLGYLAHQADLCSDAPSLGAYRHITAPECRQYILRQTFEDANHAHAYEHILDSLGVKEGRAIESYLDSVQGRTHLQLLESEVEPLVSSRFSTGSQENDARFLIAIASHFCISRGLHMAAGFVGAGSLAHSSGLEITSEMMRTIYRDRQTHVEFGKNAFAAMVNENPALLTPDVKAEIRGLIISSLETERAVLKSANFGEFSAYSNSEIDAHLCAMANNISNSLGCDPVIQTRVSSPIQWAAEYSGLNEGSKVQTKAAKESLSWD